MFRFNLWARPFLPPSGQNMEGNPFFPSPLGMPPTMAYGVVPEGKNGLHLADKDKDVTSSTATPVVPYSGAFPMLRPGDSLPHALYSPIHQQFLRAQLELANAHAREADVHPAHAFTAHSSAFAPAKRQRLEERLGERLNERLSVSPVGSLPSRQHHHSSSSTKLEEFPLSPDSHVSRGSSPREVNEGRRSTGLSDGRTTPVEDGHCCPICRCNLPSQEVTSHLAKEMHELQTLVRMSNRHSSENTVLPTRSRYETFIRIRGNREGRLGVSKLRGLRRKRPQDDESSFLSSSHDDSFRRDEEEQIDVLNCDDTERDVTRHLQISDKPHDFSRKSSSPMSMDPGSIGQQSLCCSGCAGSFTKVVPMTSTKCWHLRCESCWNMSQDHCPQCHIPLCVDDLRKILI